MTTNWFHDLFFGSNESKIKALEKLQNMDAEQFKEVFSALEKWQEAQKIDAEQFKEVFSALEKWQEAQKIDAEQFKEVFSALEEKIGTEQFQSMQEHLDGLQEKVEALTGAVGEQVETVANQERIMATCIIVSAVAAIVVTSFVVFCIYKGIKESEKEKNSSQSVATGELIDLHEPKMPDTKFGGTTPNNLKVDNLQKPVNNIAA